MVERVSTESRCPHVGESGKRSWNNGLEGLSGERVGCGELEWSECQEGEWREWCHTYIHMYGSIHTNTMCVQVYMLISVSYRSDVCGCYICIEIAILNSVKTKLHDHEIESLIIIFFKKHNICLQAFLAILISISIVHHCFVLPYLLMTMCSYSEQVEDTVQVLEKI